MDKTSGDVLRLIFSFLNEADQVVLRFVCKRWWKLIPPPIYITCSSYIKSPELFKWAWLKGCPVIDCDRPIKTVTSLHLAVETYDLPMLEWMTEHGARFGGDVFILAMRKGRSLDILEFILSKCLTVHFTSRLVDRYFKVDDPIALLDWLCDKKLLDWRCTRRMCLTLAQDRNPKFFDVVQWMYDHRSLYGKGHYMGELVDELCTHGTLEQLQHILSVFKIDPSEYIHVGISTESACMNRDIRVIQWIVEQGFDLLPGDTHVAVSQAPWEVAQWCYQTCPVENPLLYQGVLRHRQVNVLEAMQWLEQNGCPMPPVNDTILCTLAVENCPYPSSIPVLTWLQQRGYSCNITVLPTHKNRQTIHWLRQLGYTVEYLTSERPRCPVDTYEIMLEEGVIFPIEWALGVARRGALHVLKMMLEKGYDLASIAERISKDAARYDRLNVLIWMHQQGFSIDREGTLNVAKQYGHIKTVKWILRFLS